MSARWQAGRSRASQFWADMFQNREHLLSHVGSWPCEAGHKRRVHFCSPTEQVFSSFRPSLPAGGYPRVLGPHRPLDCTGLEDPDVQERVSPMPAHVGRRRCWVTPPFALIEFEVVASLSPSKCRNAMTVSSRVGVVVGTRDVAFNVGCRFVVAVGVRDFRSSAERVTSSIHAGSKAVRWRTLFVSLGQGGLF